MRKIPTLLASLILAGFLSGCGAVASTPADRPPQDEPDASGVYVEETQLLFLMSYPLRAVLVVRGMLPTPCHALDWEVEGPDGRGRIDVRLCASAPPDAICIQVPAAFEESIPLGSYTEGDFSVWLNGQRVQEFDLP